MWLQGDCAAVPADSPGSQNFCASGDLCRNHDTLGWCSESDLSECNLLQPLNGGDCKLPANLLSQFGPAATSSGLHYGASAVCVGVPKGRLSRPNAATYGKVSQVLSLLFSNVTTGVFNGCPAFWLVFQDVDGGGHEGVPVSERKVCGAG